MIQPELFLTNLCMSVYVDSFSGFESFPRLKYSVLNIFVHDFCHHLYVTVVFCEPERTFCLPFVCQLQNFFFHD